MPAFETMDLPHKAVVWPLPDDDQVQFDRYGNHKRGTPDEIDCRWTNKQSKSSDPQSNVNSWDASVVVDKEIKVGAILWKGKLADLPDPEVDLFQVKFTEITDDIKGRNTRWTLRIVRLGTQLPTSN